MFSGVNKRSLAILKLLSGSDGGTQRSSAQKKWTLPGRDGAPPRPIFRVLADATTETKNFCVMRPPDSATQCDLPARRAFSISSSHASATCEASSSAEAKVFSSNFFIQFGTDGDTPSVPMTTSVLTELAM